MILNKYDFDLRGLQRVEFFIGGSIIIDYGLYKDYGILARTVMVWSQNALMMDLFLTNTVFDYKIC